MWYNGNQFKQEHRGIINKVFGEVAELIALLKIQITFFSYEFSF